MKIDIDELSSVQRKVRVELPVETVANEFSRAYKNLGRRVRVKGFRTGKIPRTVLQGIYGDEVEADDLSESGAFSFSAVFEIKPEIAVNDYLGVEVEKPKRVITDAQVEEA